VTTTPQPTIAFNPGQAPATTTRRRLESMPPPGPRNAAFGPGCSELRGTRVHGHWVVILIFAVASVTNDNNSNNRNSNNSNKVANRQLEQEQRMRMRHTQHQLPLDVVDFTDDLFSNKVWGTGDSQYGSISYQDESYHMHATKGGFIVMYGPPYKRSTKPRMPPSAWACEASTAIPITGYGVVVHGREEGRKLEDYGFLIYNGDNPKYKIVLHKAGAETKVVDGRYSTIPPARREPD